MQQAILTQFYGNPDGLEFRILIRETDGRVWVYGIYSDPTVYQQVFRQLSDNLAQGLHIYSNTQQSETGFHSHMSDYPEQKTNAEFDSLHYSKFVHS